MQPQNEPLRGRHHTGKMEIAHTGAFSRADSRKSAGILQAAASMENIAGLKENESPVEIKRGSAKHSLRNVTVEDISAQIAWSISPSRLLQK